MFDGNCGFCKIWIHYSKWSRAIAWTTRPQQRGAEFPQIRPRSPSPAASIRWLGHDGARAAEIVGQQRTYEASGLIRCSNRLSHRRRQSKPSPRHAPDPDAHRAGAVRRDATVVLRLLAVVYGIAFASLAVQITGLVGEHGILPVRAFLESIAQNFGGVRYLAVPSIFWWSPEDSALRFVCWAGVVLAALLLTGRMTRLILILLYVLYLSLASVGQEFLSFQWDALLLETGFLAIFLGRSQTRHRR